MEVEEWISSQTRATSHFLTYATRPGVRFVLKGSGYVVKKVWVRESKGAVYFVSLTFGGMGDGLAVREGDIRVEGGLDWCVVVVFDGVACLLTAVLIGCIFCAGSRGLICVRGGGLGCAVGFE